MNRYTPKGREEIHKNLGFDTKLLLWLMLHPVKSRSIEYADNRLSLFAAQYGRCAITGEPFVLFDIHCHHKTPVASGGSDEYGNLVLVCKAVHTLIHASLHETISKQLAELKLTAKQLTKLNKMRKQAGNPVIA